MLEQERNTYLGILLTVVIGMVLIYSAYVFVGFLLAHIWSIVVLFLLGVGLWYFVAVVAKPKAS